MRLLQSPRDKAEQRLELEFAGERVSDLVHRLEVAQPPRGRFVQPSVLDRHGGLCSQKQCQIFVLIGEVTSALLLRQVQVPVRDTAKKNRNAEEALHRRMVGWKSYGARIVAEVVQPQRLRVADEHAENSPSSWKVADRGVCLRVDAGREEALQPLPGTVDDAQRGVPCAGELSRSLDELLEERVEGELRAQRDPRVDEDAQTIECGLLRHGASRRLRAQPRGSGASHRTSPQVRFGGAPMRAGPDWPNLSG